MPEYNPPNTHYCECKAFDKVEENLKFIGPGGNNFKRLTTKLHVKYIWWNSTKNIIEIWGPEDRLEHAHEYMNNYMIRFYNKHCKTEEHQHKKQRIL